MVNDFVGDHLGDLIPPGAKPKSDRQRWEWAVTVCLGGAVAIMGAHIAQACGFLGWLGLSGFALATDVSQQQQTLTQIEIISISRDIRDAKRQVCLAQQQKNEAALLSNSKLLAQARQQYYGVAKIWPDDQSCEELLITGSPS